MRHFGLLQKMELPILVWHCWELTFAYGWKRNIKKVKIKGGNSNQESPARVRPFYSSCVKGDKNKVLGPIPRMYSCLSLQ